MIGLMPQTLRLSALRWHDRIITDTVFLYFSLCSTLRPAKVGHDENILDLKMIISTVVTATSMLAVLILAALFVQSNDPRDMLLGWFVLVVYAGVGIRRWTTRHEE